MTIRMVLTYFLKTEQLTNVYEPSDPVISPHPVKARHRAISVWLLCASVSFFQRERLHWASPQEHLPGMDSHSPACTGISELHSYSWISTGDLAPGHTCRGHTPSPVRCGICVEPTQGLAFPLGHFLSHPPQGMYHENCSWVLLWRKWCQEN